MSTHAHEWAIYMDYLMAVYGVLAVVSLTVFILGLFK